MRTVADGYTLTFRSADPGDVDLLGGKGAGLAQMTQSGLPVPDGFIVSTRACRQYLADGTIPAGLQEEIAERLTQLQRRTGKTFGTGPVPLLLSVRSGAPVSMPGMMDTVLNLGLNRDAALAIAATAGDARFMAELLVRFHRMYGEIVLSVLEPGDEVDALAAQVGPGDDPGQVYDTLWQACQQAIEQDVGETVPGSPGDQLTGAVQAVFRSWNSRRARTYRDFHHIPHDLGTAVVIQSMVFGNLGPDSGSGVVFTRNPVTGERELFGEFLSSSQGEDVVAGRRIRSASWPAPCPTCTRNSGRRAPNWSAATAMCWTSSSPWNGPPCSSCRCAAPSAPPRPRSGSPPTSSGMRPLPRCRRSACSAPIRSAGCSGRASTRRSWRR